MVPPVSPGWIPDNNAERTDTNHASGGIGQPLSLLLKLNPLVTELSLYDVVNSPGVSGPDRSANIR